MEYHLSNDISPENVVKTLKMANKKTKLPQKPNTPF